MEAVAEQTSIDTKRERKEVNLNELTLNQRTLLRGGLKNELMENKAFKLLGAQQKIIFYDVCNMMINPQSLAMLNLRGEEYWEAVKVPNSKKKQQQRFIKFVFDYVIPGTNNSLSVEKVWRYEDFTP